MTSRGPFQPKTFYDSVITWLCSEDGDHREEAAAFCEAVGTRTHCLPHMHAAAL